MQHAWVLIWAPSGWPKRAYYFPQNAQWLFSSHIVTLQRGWRLPQCSIVVMKEHVGCESLARSCPEVTFAKHGFFPSYPTGKTVHHCRQCSVSHSRHCWFAARDSWARLAVLMAWRPYLRIAVWNRRLKLIIRQHNVKQWWSSSRS